MHLKTSKRHYEVRKPGSLRKLFQVESEMPPLENGKVRIAVKAIGLNYADLFAIMGLYSATPKPPFVPGLEYSGEVVESSVGTLNVGDRVFGVTRFGGYASVIDADPDYVFTIPDGWTYEEAAAFPVQALTAYYALMTLGALRENQTVLIHSAAGGVGLIANRIAKKFNAYTIGVVGSEHKLSLLAQEGFDKSIVRGGNFRNDLQDALEGQELNLVLEATGGKLFKESYRALAPMGRIVAYGSATFTPASHMPNYFSLVWKYVFRPRVDPLSMITANKSVMAFNLIWLYEKKDLLKQLMGEINELKLKPPFVGHVFPFEQLPDAIMMFKTGTTTGKVIVTCKS